MRQPAGIPCPHCGNTGKQRITNSRPKNGYVIRRRECLACGKRFTTYEKGAETHEQTRNPNTHG